MSEEAKWHSVTLRCECLVDQNRYIGSDPVGYRCMGPAAFESQDGYLICEACMYLINTAPHRISLPYPPMGRDGQEKMLREAVDHFAETSKLIH